MPVMIPNKLHFVWLGESLPLERLQTVVQWATGNPGYEVTLWVRGAFQNAYAASASALLEEDTQIDMVRKRVEHDLVRLTPSSILYDLFDMYIRAVEVLPPLTGTDVIYEPRSEWAGMPTREDMVGLWALFKEGGILLDTKCRSTGRELPLNITAQHEILLSYIHRSMPSLVNAVVAAPAESAKVAALAAFMNMHTLSAVVPEPPAPDDDGEYVHIDVMGGVVQTREALNRTVVMEMPFYQPTIRVPIRQGRFQRWRNKFRRSPRKQRPSPLDSSSESMSPPYSPSPSPDAMRRQISESEQYTVADLVRRWFEEIESEGLEEVDMTAYTFQCCVGYDFLIDMFDPRFTPQGKLTHR